MDKFNKELEIDAVIIAKEVSELIENIEVDALKNKMTQECKELVILKKMCCSENVIISWTAYHGIIKLVEKKILAASQTISCLISLLPSIIHINTLIPAIGNLMLLDLKQKQKSVKNNTKNPHTFKNIQHPFIIILKHKDDSWFEIFSFISNLIKEHDELNVDSKINLLRPVFHFAFKNSNWINSQFQAKLFTCLISKSEIKEYFNLAMELLIWKKIDIQQCFYLKEVYNQLIIIGGNESTLILSAMNPYLAESINWLIQNGYNPSPWFKLLNSAIQKEDSSLSVVLYILSDIIVETPPPYLEELIILCRSIICSASCNKYIASKFVIMALKLLVKPSSLTCSVYKILEEIVIFVQESKLEWNDQTEKLKTNKYFKSITGNRCNINFSVNLICMSNIWLIKENKLLIQWIKNLLESKEPRILIKLYSFICGIILCEDDKNLIKICLEFLFYIVNYCNNIAYTIICLLFYKLARETIPIMQKIYLFSLPKLATSKDNVLLIIGILESLKKSKNKTMSPLVIQLFLALWKSDNRTYPYLYKLLHESSKNFDFEIYLSKAIALQEICRLAPHSHGKDVINALSRVLNECSSCSSGLPSAFAVEAIIELCKAFVIDVSGTWNAVQPILYMDKRVVVMIKLCKFFGEIPSLCSSKKYFDQLNKEIITMLWDYTFSINFEVAKHAYRALSKFDLNNTNLNLIPEKYRIDTHYKMDSCDREPSTHSYSKEDISSSTFIPPECWLQFLDEVNPAILGEEVDFLKAIVERDLDLLPKGLFYLPPEKLEPQNYSYLPRKSVCRALINRLQNYSKTGELSLHPPTSAMMIIRLLSFEYKKLLPPLNWQFMSYFIYKNSGFLNFTLGLLIKQSSLSKSAKLLVENYLTDMNWSEKEEELILYLYIRLPNLCKSISYKNLNYFLTKTLILSLEISLKNQENFFKKILDNLTLALINKDIDCSYKNIIVNCLENILSLIPPEHEIMKLYALCASQFPIKAIKSISLIDEKILDKTKKQNSLHKAIIIRHAIAMRSDVKKPLSWFNETIDTAVNLFDVQNILLVNISSIIKNRRDCNHVFWLEELMSRIKGSIQFFESKELHIMLYFFDIFINAVIVLAGYDLFFYNNKCFNKSKQQKNKLLPHAFNVLIHYSEWIPLQSKLSLWFQQLLKQNWLPAMYSEAFAKCVLLAGNYDEKLHCYFLNFLLGNENEENAISIL